MQFIRKNSAWLMPAMLILFILQIIVFPFAMGITYAIRPDGVSHVITYTPGSLVWDDATGIQQNGTAELSLFDTVYNNVNSENGDSVVAPGTDLTSIIRLKNDAPKPVKYTAVVYEIKSVDYLPVNSGMNGNGFTDTNSYTLPKSAEGARVVRAVEGSIGAGEITDFDIDWLWRFYDSDEQDVVDTFLGNKAAFEEADDIVLGFYIVIQDDNEYVKPTIPGTGREATQGIYGTLMAISAVVLVVLVVDRAVSARKEKAK